ncbi:MAG: magnesium transporter [Deltaproteobacteria bacterium]|nr:magnesium transporter [Deltaproteobacteria bacterium]
MRLSKRVEFIRRLVQAGAKAKLLHGLQRLGAYSSSRVLRELDLTGRQHFVELLRDEPYFLQVLEQLDGGTQFEVISTLTIPQQEFILSKMPPEWSWVYCKELPEDVREVMLSKLPSVTEELIRKISLYPSGSCGEIMSHEIFYITADTTVEKAITLVRQAEPSSKVFYLYVVDDEKHLLGTVPLRSLIREDLNKPVSEIMSGNPVAVQSVDEQRKAAKIVSQRKLLAIPVVDETHHLLGVIRVDDVIDIVEEEATEEMYRMAGLQPEDRIFAPWWRTTQRRLLWMMLNLATAFLASWVVGLFQESISQVVALAIFMPVVAGMGGNGGTQSLTVMTRALAMGEVGRREVKRVLFREVSVGLMVGAMTGLVTGLIAWSWKDSFYLGLVLWMAMIVNMMIAGFAGSIVPILLRTLRLDPAIGSSVIVTTFTDVFGFLTFLGLATLFLKFLV